MRLQRAFPPLLIVALLATPAVGQERVEQQNLGTPAQTSTGLVSIEVQKTKPGCSSDPLGPLPPGQSCLGAVDDILELDWLAPIKPMSCKVVSEKGVGVVARADGVVVTSKALVDGADEITVVSQDGRRMAAELVKADAKTQTAVLRVAGKAPPAAELRSSSKLQSGAPLDLKTCVRETCKDEKCQHPTGVFTSLAARGDHQGDLFVFFSGPVASLPGAPLMDAEGHVLGFNTRLLTVPLPVGVPLQFAYATPTETVQRLVAEVPVPDVPLPRFSFEGLDWDWQSLFQEDSLLRD